MSNVSNYHRSECAGGAGRGAPSFPALPQALARHLQLKVGFLDIKNNFFKVNIENATFNFLILNSYSSHIK